MHRLTRITLPMEPDEAGRVGNRFARRRCSPSSWALLSRRRLVDGPRGVKTTVVAVAKWLLMRLLVVIAVALAVVTVSPLVVVPSQARGVISLQLM